MPTAHDIFQRTQRVIDALPRAIVVTDLAGVVVGWNAAAERVFGLDREQTVGHRIAEVVVPLRGIGLAEAVSSAIRTGEVWLGGYAVQRGGEVADIESHVASLTDDAGVPVGAVASSEDVTSRRLLEQQAADLTDHLRLALEAGGLGTWRWDLASGTTIWDEHLEALFGLPPGGFDGTYDAWVALLHPDDRDRVLATVEAAVQARSGYQMDHRVVWPDGSVHWTQGRGTVTIGPDGEVTGTIGCSSDITARKEVELLNQERAEQAAAAADRERRERERLEFLVDISDASLNAPDHLSYMDDVVRRAVPGLGDWCVLYFLPEGATTPETAVAHVDPERVAWVRQLAEARPFDPQAPTGPGAVIRTGSVEFLPDLGEEVLAGLVAAAGIAEPTAMLDALRSLQLTSAITVPLRSKRGIVGAMQFVSAESGRRYGAADVTLAAAASGRVADGLENLWLSDQHRRIASTLQGALLPPRLPVIEGVDLAVRYWATGTASEVGGDFYDIFPITDRRWGLVIGDVCGKGPDAAALLGLARHTIRAAAKHDVSPEGVLGWLNDALLASGRDLFATADFAVLEQVDGAWQLDSVSGGHPLPVVVRADGSVESVGQPARLLGLFPEVRAHRVRTDLHPGDTVVLYTDGVTDVPPPHDLDPDQVRKLIADAATSAETSDGVLDSIGRAMEQDLPFTERLDDIALVALRIR